jgi:hypothetical protein
MDLKNTVLVLCNYMAQTIQHSIICRLLNNIVSAAKLHKTESAMYECWKTNNNIQTDTEEENNLFLLKHIHSDRQITHNITYVISYPG